MKSIFSKVSLGFGAALGVVLAIDTVSCRSLTAFIGHVDSMSQFYRIDDALVHVLRQLQDAETGQRGFLITGQENYLQPYEQAMLTLEDDLDRMRAMVLAVDSRELETSLDALDPLVTEKLSELRKTIEVRRRDGFNAAQLLVRSDHGMRAMTDIRRLIGEMRQVTRQSIQGGELEVQERAKNTITIITVGSVLGFLFMAGASLVIHRDLAQRQRTQEQRLRLEQSLRRSETMQAIGSLVAGVAHQVRNPLFAISSTVDAMDQRLGSRSAYQKYLQVLKRESGRLAELMQHLLNYVRPPAGEPKPVRANDALNEAIQSFEAWAPQSGVRVRLEAGEDLPPLLFDRIRLVQLFHNVVENAIQFSPAAGEVRVAARAEQRDGKGWIECVVEDQGPGIASEDLPQLFEPFFSRRGGGTGLGLAVAKRIVDAAGGTITVENRAAGGAIVRVSLPCDRPGGNGEGV